MHKAVIISAPSGSGKTSIVKYLLEKDSRLSFSVSATSREIRGNEIHGKDYYFITRKEFLDKINSGQFIEWEQVYDGSYYGTLKSEMDRIWRENKVVVFDVDVKGGINLKRYFNGSALSFFIKVRDLQTLETRLRNRKTESEKSLRARIEKAFAESKFEKDFDLVIINDDLESACKEVLLNVNKFLNI